MTSMASTETIWSFGYGSNMDAATMERRKGIRPIGKSIIATI